MRMNLGVALYLFLGMMVLSQDNFWVIPDCPATLSASVISALSDDVLSVWTQCNRGCFILVFMLESGHQESVTELCSKLSPYKTQLAGLKFPGAKVLLSILE